MNEASINEQYQSIVHLLGQNRLREAQTQVEALTTLVGDWALSNRLEQGKTSYQYMLQYMQQGMNDPQRQSLYLQLCADTWEIADRARLAALDKTSHRYYHELRRSRAYLAAIPSLEERLQILEGLADDFALHQLSPQQGRSIPDDLLRKHEDTNRQTFLDIWTNSEWTAEDARQAEMWLASDYVPVDDLSLMASAVSMSLLENFDALKLQWLLQATLSHDAAPGERALVGLALALLRHGERLRFYPKLMEALVLHDEEYGLGQRLCTVFIQLLQSQDTEKISRKMQEEIIPKMMQNSDILRKLRFGSDDADEEDANPDWIEAFDKMGLNEKMQEMSELQLEGSDVYMSTFSMLKGYPFFQDLSNWFLPFSIEHSAISRDLRESDIMATPLRFVLEAGFFCNSDKYSMLFMLQQMPPAQRNMMLVQMTNGQIEKLNEEHYLDKLHNQSIRLEVISNQYIHDLYRFYKLNRRKNEFHDPFKEPITFYANFALRQLMGKPRLEQPIADYLFRKERLDEALPIYQKLITDGTTAPDIYQKVGFCLQKQKVYDEAVAAYRMADTLNPDHVWTIRHLATCYRLLKDYETALAYYRKAEEIQPENQNVLFHIGTCLAELKQYDEALKCFFRLDLMKDNNVKAWRAIGWCSLLNGRWGQAAKYYARIPETERTADDCLNAGHVAWVSGDIAGAVSHYRQSAAKFGTHAAFREAFEKDRNSLIHLGILEEDIPLMEDQTI